MSPSTHASAAGRALARDERGAIALLALFMAVFLTALVYYVAAIGETVLQRERMQDAADAAAFSAALLHARGMNTLVLVNMVMAALLAVLVALKLVELLCAIAIIAISIAAFFAPGLAAAIPPIAEVREDVKATHDALRPEIELALEALHATARAVRVMVPAASELRVLDLVQAHYRPPALAAFAALPSATLPTADGRFATLCDHAGEYTGELTQWAFDAFVPDEVADLVGDAVKDLSQSDAEWFCGSSGHAPHSTVEHEYEYPTLATRAGCEQLAQGADAGSDEHARSCSDAERDEQDSEPDDRGMCMTRCEPDGPYAERARLARSACTLAQPNGDRLYAFVWQERRYRRTYVRQRDGWLRVSSDEDEERGARYALVERDLRPCGTSAAMVGPQWELRVVDEHSGAALPLCSNAAAPTHAARIGALRELDHADVSALFSCRRRVEQRYDLSAQNSSDHVGAGGEQDSRVPQVLAAGVVLGEEPLQIRAAAIGELPAAGPAGVVELATWGAAEARTRADLAWRPIAQPDPRELGRVAVAQAEYFYALEDPEAPAGDLMWKMRWQARLRRFRLPQQDGDAAASAALAAQDPFAPAVHGSLTDACDAVVNALDRMDRKGGGPCSALARALTRASLH